MNSGITLDHFTKSAPNSVDAELSESDLDLLDSQGMTYTILIDDVSKHYRENFDPAARAAGLPACGLQNFDYGTMGHYHTFDETVAHLDSMFSKYPALITSKTTIGFSIEGRPIYAVKISDNPTIDESATEGVTYIDALHHAREPLSLEPVIYYMWWLLENYGSDPEATYIIDNRELHFIPVVNPDGVVYNQFTDPNGGGMWRKNRRLNSNGSYGVDLNRNYSSQFGNPVGSSSNPSSGTYHGDSAFSEPETRAVRDYILGIDPAIGFAVHSSGQKYLISPGCLLPLEDFESYAEFSSEFVNNAFYGYGTTSQMLGYTSCGTTRHYMHDMGIYAWTPEIGSSFWAPQNEFCSTIEAFQDGLKYVSFVSGSYPRLNDTQILSPGYMLANDTIELVIRVKNRGLTFDAQNVAVKITSLNTNSIPIDTTLSYGNIGIRDFASDTFRIAIDPSVQLMDTIHLNISVMEDGFESHSVERIYLAGYRNVIFDDDSESGMSNWSTTTWDTTSIDFQGGAHSIADTRYGNYLESDNRIMELNPKIDLTGTTNPFIEFMAKWSFEIWDNAYLEISTDGFSWALLADYTEHSHWNQQRIDVSNWSGQLVFLRLRLVSDGSVQSDGLYFDDIMVVDYSSFPTSYNETPLNSLITVYPNPVSDQLFIRNNAGQELSAELTDITGSLLITDIISSGTGSINTTALDAGIYFLKIKAAEGEMVKKILVTK